MFERSRKRRKGDPKMTFYPAKELNRRIPDKVIAFYESRLRVRKAFGYLGR
jgi:hypothetical protein